MMPWMQRQQSTGSKIVRGDVIELDEDGETYLVQVLGVESLYDPEFHEDENLENDEFGLDGVIVAINGKTTYRPYLTTVHGHEPVEVVAHQDAWDWSADYARRAAVK